MTLINFVNSFAFTPPFNPNLSVVFNGTLSGASPQESSSIDIGADIPTRQFFILLGYSTSGTSNPTTAVALGGVSATTLVSFYHDGGTSGDIGTYVYAVSGVTGTSAVLSVTKGGSDGSVAAVIRSEALYNTTPFDTDTLSSGTVTTFNRSIDVEPDGLIVGIAGVRGTTSRSCNVASLDNQIQDNFLLNSACYSEGYHLSSVTETKTITVVGTASGFDLMGSVYASLSPV